MKQTEKLRKIHDEAIRAFDKIQSALYAERKQCLEDRRFYSIAGAQWEGALEDQFANKPQFEINKVHLSLIKIFNDYRNNRVTVDYISKDGSPTGEMAETCNGLFRADEQDSGAQEAYDNAFEEAVGGGYGAIRVISSYEDEEDEDNDMQRIRIEPIYDADSSVFFDLDAKRQDKADAKYCFVIVSKTRESFEGEWPDTPASLQKEVDYVEYDWYSPDLIYIAEYYLIEEKKETVRIFENISGEEQKYYAKDFEENEDLERELAAVNSQEIRTKIVKTTRVHKYIISGNEILEDYGVLAGKFIPIVPIFGKRWFVDSVERCMGHVRLVKDAQRLKNMLTSKLAEIAALSTVEKPIFTPEQIIGHEVQWSEDNIKNFPYLTVNGVKDATGALIPSGPVAYTKVAEIPPALAMLLAQVDVDINELLGSTGNADKMISHVSAKAHEIVDKRIDGQAFIYMSNFAKGIKRIGEVWLSQAKEIYVEEGRTMKSIDSMGKSGTVELMQPGLNTKNAPTEKNDFTKATFDVAVDVGPSSASQRDATVSTLTSILATTTDPETRQILEAMIMMNIEGEGLSEANEYYRKKLVEMGVLKPTAEEAEQMAEAAKNAKPDPEAQALEAMAAEAIAKAEKTKVEIPKVVSDTELNKAKTAETYADIDINKATTVSNLLGKNPDVT